MDFAAKMENGQKREKEIYFTISRNNVHAIKAMIEGVGV